MLIKYKKYVLTVLVLIITISVGFLFPAKMIIPVAGATRHDWNHQTFWNERWGRSGIHKGIDIFARVGRPVLSSTYGLVLYKGERLLGGNTILILGPKWRIHYYAHLKEVKTDFLSFVRQKEVIGTVGRTGNAKNKPSHLHYSVMSLAPLPWYWDNSRQGWKKIFFLDPTAMLLPKHKIKMAKKKRNKVLGSEVAKNTY